MTIVDSKTSLGDKPRGLVFNRFGFAMTVLLSVAMGVGINAAIFSNSLQSLNIDIPDLILHILGD